MSRLVGKQTMWFRNRPDTKQAVQPKKTPRSLKFQIEEEEELYFPSSENKGADHEADLRLCFRQWRLLVSSWGGSYIACLCLCSKCNALIIYGNKKNGFGRNVRRD